MFVGIGVGIGRNRFAQGIFNAYNLRVVADGGITEAGQCVDAVTGILLNASLLLIPSGYKGGKLYSEIPTNGNGDLTWTRGSDAFRTNASGLIQRVPWNLVQQSETFDNAIWGKTNGSITTNSTTAPNGTATADTYIPNTVNSYHPLVQTITVTSGTQYTFSIYVKSAGYDYLLINTSVGSASGNVGPLFNLSTGTLIGSLGGNNYGATITSVANGFYRIVFSYVTNATSTVIDINPLPTSSISTYSGNGTSGLYLWGAQLVEGTTAQTYLPTTDRLNFPRLSYMYGSCPSALLEPQRTNLALYSDQFDNASWVKVASSITANTTTSPDGMMNADTLAGDGSLGFHFIQQAQSVVSGTSYSISVYAKKNTNNIVQIFTANASFGTNVWANFDLNNGVVGSVGSSTTASIQNVGNGWYRCVIVGVATSTGTSSASSFGLVTSSTSVRAESNTLSTSVFIYGAQLEAGAYPTTIIPTTTASATRIADSFSRNNIYTNGLITSSGGTWFVELRNNIAYTRDSSGALYIGTNSTDANAGNGLLLRNPGGSTRILIRKVISGVGTDLYQTVTDTIKVAIKWNGTSCDVFVNGTKQVSASAFTTTNMEFLNLNSIPVPYFIQQMALFPTPLSDTDCTTLTT